MSSTLWRGGRLAAGAIVVATTLGLLAGLDGPGYAQTPSKTKPKATKTPAVKFAPAVAIPSGPPGTVPAANEEPIKAINDLLEKSWQENKVKVKDGEVSMQPSAVCSDFDFIRRASLDIIGRIATPEEIAVFMKDPASTRRALLIERLLGKSVVKGGKAEPDKYREEFAANWAHIWTTWLLTRAVHHTYRDQMQLALQEEFEKDNLSYKELVFKLLTATGKTNETGFVNYILAHLGEPVPANKQAEEGQYEMVPVTSRTTRLFLGFQTQCTQCHDHPFNPDWKQGHFWGVNAFFRQVAATNRLTAPSTQRNKMDNIAQPTLSNNNSFNAGGIIYYEKRNAVVMPTKAVFLDGSKYPTDSKLPRREVLANLITNHDQFAKAYVNRMWGHFFGRGMNENPPVDDFGEHNKVVHPELLDKLARGFSTSAGYDPKVLIRWICSSKAYNLSAVANPTNRSQDAEPFFSRMLVKSMSPEQLFESMMVATSRNESKEAKKRMREIWLALLTTNFGDDEGNEVTFNGTVVQALLMMNGEDMNKAVMSPSGTPARAMAMHRGNPKAAMDELYLSALNRRASPQEYNTIMKKLAFSSGKGIGPELHAWQDLFWALLNSNEFILNH